MEFEDFVGIIADVMNIDAEDITGDLLMGDDLGADSLDVAQIATTISDEYGVDLELENEDVERYQNSTIAEIFDVVKARLDE